MVPFSAPAFSFCFPLLNIVLRESSGNAEDTEAMQVRALQVINEHAELRSTSDNPDTLIDEVRASICLSGSVFTHAPPFSLFYCTLTLLFPL